MIEKEILKQKLVEGKSKKQIREELAVSHVTLKKYINTYNLEEFYCFVQNASRQLSNKSVDLNFFKKIDSEEKAYIFGIILSDGWIGKNKFGITLQDLDVDVLLKIKQCLKSKHKISYKSHNHRRPQYTFTVSSKEIVEDLKALGITTNKSFEAFIPFDKIPKHLLKHAIRGIFDGDGSFSQNQPCISTSSETMKDDIISWSFNNYNYIPSVSLQEGNYRLYFRKPGFKVICDVYTDSNIYLNRKFNSFQEYYKYRMKNQ